MPESSTYEATFAKPLTGWLGFYFQLSFPGANNTITTVTSETNVIPQTFPYPDCYGQSCLGTLV
jgi:hypothetical protein